MMIHPEPKVGDVYCYVDLYDYYEILEMKNNNYVLVRWNNGIKSLFTIGFLQSKEVIMLTTDLEKLLIGIGI